MVIFMAELTIKGVDVEKGIEFSGARNFGEYIEILEIFCKEVREKLDLLIKCVEEKNISLYTTYIHAVKSACASIGASEVSQIAEALELVGKQGDFGVIANSNDDFIKSATRLLDDIQEAIKDKTPAVINENFDSGEIISKLETLRAALEDYNITLIDQLSVDLQLYTSHPTLGSTIDKILHNAFITSYDKAVEHIDDIL